MPRFALPSRALVGALALLALPAPASAALNLEGTGTSVTVPGSAHGNTLWPGDSFQLQTSVQNEDVAPVNGARGTLTSGTPDLALTQDASPFPSLTFGVSETNTTPFAGTLAASATCGAPVPVNLHVTAGTDGQDLSYAVPTGTPGPPLNRAAVDLPKPVRDNATTSSTLLVSGTERIKRVRVHIDSLRHTYDGDLKLVLVAPDGTQILLADSKGGEGDDFTGTVFDDGAARTIGSASAPFSGSFQPQQPLGVLEGRPAAGSWTLRVTDQKTEDTGTLNAWSLDISAAICSSRPLAAFTSSPAPGTPNSPITFDGRDSVAPGGTITDYGWDWNADGTIDDHSGTTSTIAHTFPDRGAHRVRLQITDDQGDTGEVTQTVPVGTPPVAVLTASPTTLSTGANVTLDATGSHAGDPGGSIARYEWDLDGNGTFERSTGTVATLTTTYARPGAVHPQVRVTDDAGVTDIHAVDLEITNRAPTAVLYLPAKAVTGQVVTLDGRASSDPDGTIVSYEWHYDNQVPQDVTSGQPTTQHSWSTPGTYTLSFRVKDDSGTYSALITRSILIQVPDAPPTAALTVSPNPVPAGAPVLLDASASRDSDGSIVAYAWDLDGNGSYETDGGTTPTLRYSFPNPGIIPVGVQVTDDRGVSTTRTVSLRIVAATGGGGGGGGGGGTNPGGGPPVPASFRAALAAAKSQKLSKALTRGVAATCQANRRSRCTVAVTVSARDARRLGLSRHARKPVTVARATVRLDGTHARAVTLRLTRAARRALKRRHTRRLALKLSASVLDEAAHRLHPGRAVTLRR